MPKGVQVQLFDESDNPIANASNIQCVWFDATNPSDFVQVKGKVVSGTTDASGWMKLNLSAVSDRDIGEEGFLLIYRPGALYTDDEIFASKLTLQDVTGGQSVAFQTDWVRHPGWLTMDSIGDTEEKFLGLHAIYDTGSNYLALKCTGNYNVNWGDGNNENVSSGVVAEKAYTYSSISGSTDAGIAYARSCTFQDTGDTVTLTGHGFINGQKVSFNVINSTTGISTYTTYYVRDKTTNTFKVAATLGGTALTLTNDGTGSCYVPLYRQVLVTVTPQAGANLTHVDIDQRHSSAGAAYDSGWLQIILGSPSLRYVCLGNKYVASEQVWFRTLEAIWFASSRIYEWKFAFQQNLGLKSVILAHPSNGIKIGTGKTANATTDRIEWTAHGLQEGQAVNLIDSGTTEYTSDYMYYAINVLTDSFQLTSGGLFDGGGTYGTPINNTVGGTVDLVAGSQYHWAFAKCSAMVSGPTVDFASAIWVESMFRDCTKLTTMPFVDLSNCPTARNMFYNCDGFVTGPSIDFSGVLWAGQFFYDCDGLVSVPQYDLSGLKTADNFFAYCSSLTTVPSLDLSSCVYASAMFAMCTSLVNAPAITFVPANGGDGMSFFEGCTKLKTIPPYDVSGWTNFSSMFASCPALEVGRLEGTSASISYLNCELSATELDSVYTGLASATATITVTGNPGVTGDTPSIATAKGWTVTG